MWIEVGTRQELERARKKVVDAGDRQIVVVWHEGAPYAMDNICIHQQRELVKGVVLNGRLVCPGHQWAYELGTGYCRERDRTQPTFRAKEEDGVVYVDATEAQPAAAGGEETVWPRSSS
jgi:nitrite reductase (NADH) small subunit